MDTQHAINYFFKDNLRSFSQETVKSYSISLIQFFNFCGKKFDEVNREDIFNWLANLNTRDIKPRSQQLKLSSLRTFYNYCIEEGFIKKNPAVMVKSIPTKDSQPVYLTRNDLARLKEAAKNTPRERAIIETLYNTGVRIGELLNIHLEDIKWDSMLIWIRKGKGNTQRFVPFTFECASRLKEYLDNRNINSLYLFANKKGGPLSRVWVEQVFKKYSDNIDLGYKVTPHTLRHTIASHLGEKSMSQSYLQELLGHKNINSTGIYTNLSEENRRNQYEYYQ